MVSASNFISVDKDLLSSSVNGFLPKVAVIPLSEDDTEGLEVLVREGDRVKEGDVIAKTKGLHIHSSVPGIVQKIEQMQYSNGKQGLCAFVALNGAFSYLGKKSVAQEWQSYESQTVLFLLREAGVVNSFGKLIPIATQIKKTKNANSSAVVVRLFDCDPSFVTESFMASNYLAEVLEGTGIIARAFGVKSVILAYSVTDKNNLKDRIDSLLAERAFALFGADTDFSCIGIDTKKYPAGTMHDITAAVKKANKSESVEKLGKKDLFVDSCTSLNAYNAVALRKPLVSTFVHVTGDCLNSAAMLNVRVGTPLRDIVEQCGGFKRELSKIIINGIVSGKAVSSLDIPVSRGMKSVEFVPARQVTFQCGENCVRCGNCRKICPVHLWPGNLFRIAHLSSLENACEADKNAYKSVILCSECGLCNAVCSSRLPLVQTISILKDSYHEE
ncbi:MAG: SLBB domain-containing protein [Treponema sp.]|uniref:4Fe-4S dicluster domain-containing protein n=1 Tax=Treponema sp. TaxID=166 RepID=UPI0025F04ECF|nr:4Fe-4S dicluster domain-containing protein [Treponema sp.]MBQ8680544.1 SLBB domain-containing protein [Treponema sp.]